MRQVMRICFVGDSFVNGIGDPECLGWAGRLCAAAGRRGHEVTCYNLGVRGDTSADVAARWRRETARRLDAADERGIVFSFGVNDTAADGDGTRVSPDGSLDNLRRILAAAVRRYRVLFVGPPPVADREQNLRVAALSDRFAAECRALGVRCLPVLRSLAESETWTREAAAGDGAHPGARGYAELARLVEAWEAWRAWVP